MTTNPNDRFVETGDASEGGNAVEGSKIEPAADVADVPAGEEECVSDDCAYCPPKE